MAEVSVTALFGRLGDFLLMIFHDESSPSCIKDFLVCFYRYFIVQSGVSSKSIGRKNLQYT